MSAVQAASIAGPEGAEEVVSAAASEAIEEDVQALLAEMHASFKTFSESVFAKSTCQACGVSARFSIASKTQIISLHPSRNETDCPMIACARFSNCANVDLTRLLQTSRQDDRQNPGARGEH
jgi:hypothetical protein